MRLIDYNEFCKMPAGTIFAPYTPTALEEHLAIKVDEGKEYTFSDGRTAHCFNGVMPLEPSFDPWCMLYEPGDREDASFEVYDGDNNDYDDDQMFLVFEEQDIDKMINVLKWAKNGCVGDIEGEVK